MVYRLQLQTRAPTPRLLISKPLSTNDRYDLVDETRLLFPDPPLGEVPDDRQIEPRQIPRRQSHPSRMRRRRRVSESPESGVEDGEEGDEEIEPAVGIKSGDENGSRRVAR